MHRSMRYDKTLYKTAGEKMEERRDDIDRWKRIYILTLVEMRDSWKNAWKMKKVEEKTEIKKNLMRGVIMQKDWVKQRGKAVLLIWHPNFECDWMENVPRKVFINHGMGWDEKNNNYAMDHSISLRHESTFQMGNRTLSNTSVVGKENFPSY